MCIYIYIFIYVYFILFFDVCFVEIPRPLQSLYCFYVAQFFSAQVQAIFTYWGDGGGGGRGGGCVLMYADVRNILLSSWVTKANDGRRDAVRLRSRRHTRLVGWLDPKCCEMLPCERSRDWYGAGLNYVSVKI